jgi:hypothetical protein
MQVNDPKNEVDHINHNPLDNRKENLRICTRRENSRNRTKGKFIKRPSSRYKGVSFDKKLNKWIAAIGLDTMIYIGCFTTEEDAAFAYNIKAKEIFGEFACLNEVDIAQITVDLNETNFRKCFKYVSYDKDRKRWVAKKRINGVIYRANSNISEQEALTRLNNKLLERGVLI